MLWWTDDLATGIESIDSQHKTLFEKINKCLFAADDQALDELKETLEYLTDYVIFHFSEEEKLMIRELYEAFPEHRDKHTYFIKQVFSLKKRVHDEGMGEEISQEMKVLLVEWLVDHIDHDDKLFAQSVQGQ